jgi:NAD(P)-dependent dehydrogenase (short-subunit alcohol dehydrogenase family)
MTDGSLDGRVALVTGASRGIGKGIACALGEAGAVVYVTGRSVAGKPRTTSLQGTLEETAAEITTAGGFCHAIECDHRLDEQVEFVFDQIEHEQGRLDLLANNVWGGYELLHEGRFEPFEAPFWDAPLSLWDDMFAAGVRAHYVSSRLAVPLLLRCDHGLIVNISSFAAMNAKEHVALGVAKAATDRMSALMAEQLRDHGVAVVSLYPGLVRTEGILKWEDYIDLSNSESPRFVGRAIAALASDGAVMEQTGKTLVVAELAEEYGFTDEDGKRPRSLRDQFEPSS